jgi:hypothetical protein
MTAVIRLIASGIDYTFANDNEILIGRAESADVRLANPYVSRRHGRLTRRSEGWVYEDIGSTRGTMFRGRRIEELLLVGPVTLLLGEPGRGEEVHIRPEHPSRIFICYRRDDAGGHAGRLRDRLAAAFGDSQIFLDIDRISIGEDFVDRVTRVVSSCRVLLVVIGRRWLDCQDDHGGRRIDDPQDYVRLEILTALRRTSGITVIPILVQGASMPREEDLPSDIAALSRRNALILPDERWRSEIDLLVERLETIMRIEHDEQDASPKTGEVEN